MESNNRFEIATSPKKRVVSLTAVRLKRIQDFKILSGMDFYRYGRLGSQKWARELHTFLDDQGVTLEDIQHWMNTKYEVTEPLPERLTRRSSGELSSETGRPIRACRLYTGQRSTPENLRRTSESQRSTSQSPMSTSERSRSISDTDSQYSGNTTEVPRTYNSRESRNYSGLFLPSPINSERNSPVTEFDLLSFGNTAQNDSAEYSRVNSGAQNHFTPENPSQQDNIAQQPDVSSRGVILRDVQNGFFALETLDQLARKYTRIHPTVAHQIRKIYLKLEELRMTNIFGEIPQPDSLAPHQESDSETECIEVVGNLNNPDVCLSQDIQQLVMLVIFMIFPILGLTAFFNVLY